MIDVVIYTKALVSESGKLRKAPMAILHRQTLKQILSRILSTFRDSLLSIIPSVHAKLVYWAWISNYPWSRGIHAACCILSISFNGPSASLSQAARKAVSPIQLRHSSLPHPAIPLSFSLHLLSVPSSALHSSRQSYLHHLSRSSRQAFPDHQDAKVC